MLSKVKLKRQKLRSRAANTTSQAFTAGVVQCRPNSTKQRHDVVLHFKIKYWPKQSQQCESIGDDPRSGKSSDTLSPDVQVLHESTSFKRAVQQVQTILYDCRFFLFKKFDACFNIKQKTVLVPPILQGFKTHSPLEQTILLRLEGVTGSQLGQYEAKIVCSYKL